MRLNILVLLILLLILSSCSTKQFLIHSSTQDINHNGNIFVLSNDSSFIIPVAVYPTFHVIDNFVINAKPAIYKIDSLICTEVAKQNIKCTIVNDLADIEKGAYYIRYQDYWAWDFKKYMHVLKISLNKSDKEVKCVVSQGNTAGMHDYPNPKKQVPLLIEMILKN